MSGPVPVCRCGHMAGNHLGGYTTEARAFCLIGGCACKRYEENAEMGRGLSGRLRVCARCGETFVDEIGPVMVPAGAYTLMDVQSRPLRPRKRCQACAPDSGPREPEVGAARPGRWAEGWAALDEESLA